MSKILDRILNTYKKRLKEFNKEDTLTIQEGELQTIVFKKDNDNEVKIERINYD